MRGRKKVRHTYDAHLSDVLSYPVHLHVIHAARRRLTSKRKWKTPRIEPKKKKYRRQATPIFLAQHVTLRLHVYVANTDDHSYPFLQNFFSLEKINSYNDKQRLERNRFFLDHEMNHTVFCLWPSELSLVLLEDFKDITNT